MKRKMRNILVLAGSLLLGGSLASQGALLTSCSVANEGSLVIDSLPVKTNYNLDDTLDLTGLVVYGKIADGNFLSNTESVLIEDYKTSIRQGAKLATEGVFDVVISKKGYASTSFKISVGDVEVNKLVIRSLPRKLSYKVGEKFNSNGLSLSISKFVNGVEVGNGTNLANTEYQTSINNGQVLEKEGSYLVEVYKKGYESVYFQISVLTENTDLTNIISTLKNSKNYEMEIYNTVATTVDENGFHYKEVVNEKYFNKVTYNKSQPDEPEEERGLSVGTDIAYVNYDKGVYQVDLKNRTEETNDPKPGKILSGESKWYKADLVTVFNAFDPKTAPTTTKNGKFVIEVVLDSDEKIRNIGVTNEDWSVSVKNNPFAATFLSVCGWSDSLISILTTIEIETDGQTFLNIKGNLGGYGYTTLNVKNIGSSKVDDLETYVARTDRTFDTSVDDIVKEPKLVELFTSNLCNYTQTHQGRDSNGNTFNSWNIYYGSNFIWFEPTTEFRTLYHQEYNGVLSGSGFISVNKPNAKLKSMFPDSDEGKGVYSIIGKTTTNSTYDTFVDSIVLDGTHVSLVKDLVGGVSTPRDPAKFKEFSYDCPALKGEGLATSYIFKDLQCFIDSSLEVNYANSWFAETRLSTEAEPFIISYEPKVLEILCESILGKGSYNQYKSQFNSAIISPSYEIDDMTKKITKVNSIELWCLNLNTYSGYVNSLTEINETALPSFVVSGLQDAGVGL